MEKTQLLCKLMNQISPQEWSLLKMEDSSLLISEHNRKSLLNMKTMVADSENLQGSIADENVRNLQIELQNYLNRYMAEQPEGHKWIILSCLFLAFIQRLPMHPQDVVKISTEIRSGETVYYCPCKSEETHSICSYCVCKKKRVKYEAYENKGETEQK